MGKADFLVDITNPLLFSYSVVTKLYYASSEMTQPNPQKSSCNPLVSSTTPILRDVSFFCTNYQIPANCFSWMKCSLKLRTDCFTNRLDLFLLHAINHMQHPKIKKKMKLHVRDEHVYFHISSSCEACLTWFPGLYIPIYN